MDHPAVSAVPAWVPPMLATPDGGVLPEGPGWAYEFKWDGYRATMQIAVDGTTILTSRNNNDFTRRFPELTAVFGSALGGRAAVLDGEIVAMSGGHPDFALLQNHRPGSSAPVAFLAFDLLALGGESLLDRPYDDRRALLDELTPHDASRAAITPCYRYTDLAESGLTPRGLLAIAAAQGLEGLVAKDRASTYRPGARSPAWRKHPLVHTTEVILCGFRSGQGRLTGTLGAVLLGAHDPTTGELVYLGDVGTGWSDATRHRLHQQLLALEQPAPPITQAVPRAVARGAHWVRPVLVGDVAYRNLTPDRRLRHTAWRGLRPDRDPPDVKLPLLASNGLDRDQ